MRIDLLERLDRNTDKADPSGCWIWTGGRRAEGYGAFTVDGLPTYAHRASYLARVGEIPEGWTIDHLCRNRLCINPEHLEAVTHRTNILRGKAPAAANAVKTHCIRGHEFTPDNIYVVKLRNGNTGRHCKTCHRLRSRGLLDTPAR